MVVTQAAVAVVCIGGLVKEHVVVERAEAASLAFRDSPARQAACFAAIARKTTSQACPNVRSDQVLSTVPSAPVAHGDWPYGRCQQGAKPGGVLRCDLLTGGGGRLVIAGDSHITQWIPAILPWARAHDLQVITFLRSGCPLSKGTSWGSLCASWNDQVRETINGLRPDYLMTSVQSADNERAGVHQLLDVVSGWRTLRRSGTQLIAFRDIPQPRLAGFRDIGLCVSSAHSFDACDFPVTQAIKRDLVVKAARRLGDVAVIDATDWFCPQGVCRPQINGILVWIDGSHMSSYFARGLSAVVSSQLDRATAES